MQLPNNQEAHSREAYQGALMPNAASAMATLVMAHPSPQIVERSPGPSTPMGSLAQDTLH